MWGEDTIFEKQMRDFEAIEKDENKNVDEDEANEGIASSEQQRSESQANRFGVFGYSKDDTNTSATHYETEGEAKAAAAELARELNGKDLDYIEVWQADEEGRFGVSGEPIWKVNYKPGGWFEAGEEKESKTNEEANDYERVTDLPVGAEPDKPELSEPNPPKEVLQELLAAWELIGSMDDDPQVRTMADEKAEELHSLITSAE